MARPKSDIQSRIIETARTRFLVDGVEGASLREIAREADTNIGMVYYYFPTKDDLFVAVLQSAYPKIVQRIEGALAPGASVAERFERLYTKLDMMSDEERDIMRLMLREVIVGSPRLERLTAMAGAGHVPLLMQLITDAYMNGDFDREHPPMIVLVTLICTAIMPHVVVPPLARALSTAAPDRAQLPTGAQLGAMISKVVLSGLRPRGDGQ